MSIIQIACLTWDGAPFELDPSFFDLKPDEMLVGPSIVVVCRDGIAVRFAIGSKTNLTMMRVVLRDGPLPPGIVAPANAPASTSDGIERLQR